MMKLEEKIKQIKSEADSAIYAMKDHKLVEDKKNTSFDDAIYKMHNAANKDELAKAYTDYIQLAICNHYNDACIIAGIMQNAEMNKKYGVDIDKVIGSLITNFRNVKPVDLGATAVVKTIDTQQPESSKQPDPQPVVTPVIKPDCGNKNRLEGMTEEQIRNLAKEYDPKAVVNGMGATSADIAVGDLLGSRQATRKAAYEWVQANDNEESGGRSLSNNLKRKIIGKMKFIANTPNKIAEGKCNNPLEEIDKARKECESVSKIILSIKPDNLSEEDLAELNDTTAALTDIMKKFDEMEIAIKNAVKQAQTPNSNPGNTTPVQQTLAAHTIGDGGFNISNFIKDKPPVQQVGPIVNHQHKTVFPHQICGLNDQQIVEEVNKHFKVIQSLPAYALYDLVNNKLLAEKMREFGSKQRPNNPFLTQVDINKYIDIPELLNTYNVCFTTPCKDKSQVIVVLFNTVPVADNCGCMNYPINIFKAKLVNN